MPEDTKDPGMAALNQRDLRNTATPFHEPIVQDVDYDALDKGEDQDPALPEPDSEYEKSVIEHIHDQKEWIKDETEHKHEDRTREDMKAEEDMVADAYKEQADEAKAQHDEYLPATDEDDEVVGHTHGDEDWHTHDDDEGYDHISH